MGIATELGTEVFPDDPKDVRCLSCLYRRALKESDGGDNKQENKLKCLECGKLTHPFPHGKLL
jgi:hypothetical protein